jgi:hypothetical protein
VARIILASRKPIGDDYCSWDVFGWIRKPLRFQQLKACIRGVPEQNTGG